MVSPWKENRQRDYSRYDQMPTAELEQLLCLDFQASEEGNPSDLDALLYVSSLLAQRKGPFDPDAAWRRFQTEYLPYADGRSLYAFGDEGDVPRQAPAVPPRASPRPARRLRRLAVLAAVLATLLLGGIAAQAAGVDIWGAIAQWTDETFRFVPAGSGGPATTDTDMEPLLTSLQPWGMDTRFPTGHLDGFVPGELNLTEAESDGTVSAHVTFFGAERIYSVVIIHYTEPQTNTGIFEKDDTPVEEYIHNSQVFYILSNLNSLTATTYDGRFMTIIAGDLTRDEIKAVIDSINGGTD